MGWGLMVSADIYAFCSEWRGHRLENELPLLYQPCTLPSQRDIWDIMWWEDLLQMDKAWWEVGFICLKLDMDIERTAVSGHWQEGLFGRGFETRSHIFCLTSYKIVYCKTEWAFMNCAGKGLLDESCWWKCFHFMPEKAGKDEGGTV